MPKRERSARKKSDETRDKILAVALKLFRRHGFSSTTMRQIADGAGLSLGAAYYYFESKEAILFSYYAHNRSKHETLARAGIATARDLRDKLAVIFHSGLKTIEGERELLGALVGRLADPRDPLSAFSNDQRAVREQSIALFASALDGEPLPDELRPLVAPALWLAYMGLLLYFVNDDSPAQAQSHRLVDDAVDMIAPLLALAGSPFAAPLRAQLESMLSRAGLFPS